MSKMLRVALGTGLSCLLTACVNSSTDFVAKDYDSKVVTIGAGTAVVSTDEESGWRLWYIIEPGTRTCWLKIGDSVGALDCCQLWLVERARRHISWLTASECAARLAPRSPLATRPPP
jgi:hypothetical protein